MDLIALPAVIIGGFAALVIIGLTLAVRDLRRKVSPGGTAAPERKEPFIW